jgi:hypothetical protein
VAVVLGALIGGGTPAIRGEEARDKAPRAKAGRYTDWQFQADKKRHYCRYHYVNSVGQAAFQYVLYYPDDERNRVYYFQTPSGQLWGCVVRPGAPGYSPTSAKWYRQLRDGKWTRRADGQCPLPPDGGPMIADYNDAPLPATPPPEAFAQLSKTERPLAEAFHKQLAEVQIDDGQIVGLDFANSERANDGAVANVALATKLRRLYLEGTPVSDSGLKYLTGLKELAHLDLSQTGISDAGMAELARLEGLRTLIIRGCHDVSADAIRAARKTNPKLLITGP